MRAANLTQSQENDEGYVMGPLTFNKVSNHNRSGPENKVKISDDTSSEKKMRERGNIRPAHSVKLLKNADGVCYLQSKQPQCAGW